MFVIFPVQYFPFTVACYAMLYDCQGKAIEEVLDASRRQEPVIESGNKYGVAKDLATGNGKEKGHVFHNIYIYGGVRLMSC